MLLSQAMNYGRVWSDKAELAARTFIKLWDVMCVCWGWCMCVCFDVCFSPRTPEFIVSWTHWHQTTAKPFQTYRCSTKQRAGWMVLVHMQGIPEVSGGQQHKTWGESSRQTDVRCRTSHPVPPQAEMNSKRLSWNPYKQKDIIAEFLYHLLGNAIAPHPVWKWRQDSLESGKNGDVGPNSWSCWSRFTCKWAEFLFPGEFPDF